ncbi:uncharacterized protein LOC132185261 [Corylus avellana]|uniref:uncharacterized protein LOC132185261 n=1 Tax=Corylus avellana TaxID=13451 RepID=UPI00286BA415|nr:uncharacterized protein LOC132185261 [Corylus avellana]
MADDLTKMWGNFSLSDEEGEELEIKSISLVDSVKRGQSCLVGKLVSDRMVSKEIIRSKLIRGWRPTGSLSFKVLGDNLFLLDFEHSWDKSHVLEGRPWVFEGSLFAVEDFDGVTPQAEIEFEKVAFWVRMLNMPLACMCKDVGLQIGASLGSVEEVDTDEEGIGWGEYLRVRIKLDLKRPLLRGKTLKVEGRVVKVVFQYEKLPRYCFHCGCISHGRAGCQSPKRALMKGEKPRFGPWLRAESPTRRREREWHWRGGSGEHGGERFSMTGGSYFQHTAGNKSRK